MNRKLTWESEFLEMAFYKLIKGKITFKSHTYYSV